jgi:hypothetical protein
MNPATGATTSALLRRWERLHVQIRCALQPAMPSLIRQYLACGTLLARRGQLDATAAQRRMLVLLLQTARDEALPWFWRSLCLEHTTQPLARLSARLRLHDPLALAALEAAVRQAIECLPNTPSAGLAARSQRLPSPAGPQMPLTRRSR